GNLRWRVAYSFVDATYQSQFVVSAESNSSADANGDIVVHPGDRLPLVPRQTGRLVLDYRFSQRLQLGANLVVASGSYLHGNENNANVAGGTNAAGQVIAPDGTGWIPSYALVNLQGTYRLGESLQLFARVVNLLNAQYGTAGFLTVNTFTPSGSFRTNPDEWTNENALSPGAPRGIWAGIRLRLD
ncbi:MAG TPA: TonB-dependent receptor, partial [Steroidobacteraceae bacterium]|nr:TonB-dependent receptor [Steroidobacteraceae bacterium]